MKIAEVEKDKEYAIRQDYSDPRRVKVLGIVTVEERVWDRVLENYKVRNVRRAQVKFLDHPDNRLRQAAKGHRENVEARMLIAPWSELGPNLQKRAAEKQAADDMREQLEKRLKSLLGRNYGGYVFCDHATRPGLRVDGKSVFKLLELAELGKEGLE